MKIVGLNGLSEEEFVRELRSGATFRIYSYCVSLLVVTMKNPTNIYFVRSNESKFMKGLPYSLISMLVGWWGIPFGFIYTPWAIISNCCGGTDVTAAVLESLRPQEDTEGSNADPRAPANPFMKVENRNN